MKPLQAILFLINALFVLVHLGIYLCYKHTHIQITHLFSAGIVHTITCYIVEVNVSTIRLTTQYSGVYEIVPIENKKISCFLFFILFLLIFKRI